MRLTSAQVRELRCLFGDRVTFDGTERTLYSHDIAAIPKMVKPLIGNTVPDAVVQPESEEELVSLAAWSRRHRVPLVPRGKASSGYGGAVPVKNGVVVDFYRMKDVLSVDENTATVTVEPGITWERLDNELHHHGLTLRLYPSSYPSSTVGGWLAQGGAGFGSYQYGYFRENVISAVVVLPTGEVRKFSGSELELVSDAEGTTGLLCKVTLRVQILEDLELLTFACETPHDLQEIIESIMERDLPIWSVMFINPRMAASRNMAQGFTGEGEGTALPEAYIVTLTYRAGDADRVRGPAGDLIESSGATVLSGEIAEHEWENRFRIMLIKRLGPSLVPTEVIVPVSELGSSMAEIERKISKPVLKEGVIVRNGPAGEPEAVLLGFIPSDERKLGYNFMFGLSLSTIKIAEGHRGRPFSTGLYFTSKANAVLGSERASRLRAFKKKIDPGGLMNPGKVVDGSLVGAAVGLAGLLEPLIRPLGNLMHERMGERHGSPVRGIPGDIAWYAYSCSQCGYCVDDCDQFYGRGWESQSPRGKWYWLRQYMEGRAKWDQKMVDAFMVCTTCELCDLRCSAYLPIEHSWMQLRGILINEEKRMTIPPLEMMAAALESEGDIWAGYRKDRGDWFPEDLLKRHGPGTASRNVYFAGCTASYVEKDIGIATVRLLDEAGIDFTYLGVKENCCATPMLVAGKWDLFQEVMKDNIAAVKETGADTVICSCPACDMMWRNVYPDWAEKLGIEYGLTARHYSEVVSEKIRSGEFTFPETGNAGGTVTFHDSCHIGRVSGVYEAPRDLIKAIPGTEIVEMEHSRESAYCCGSVLTLIKDPPVAAEVGKVRLDEAVETGADKVVALCPCCEFQFRVSADKNEIPLEVVDLAHLAAGALGYDLPDPHPEVRRQWAVFEAMIALMTPEGFADLMGTMWDELVEAMPLGMGKMMRLAGRVPGLLELMKPAFPVLFPVLLPMMMPKVMPVMLDRVAERVPMPDYMREQMPELMPKVMDNLMPHMISDVVPLITSPLIRHLQGRPVPIAPVEDESRPNESTSML